MSDAAVVEAGRPSRAKIVEYLVFQGGSVSSTGGRGLTSAMAHAVGYRDPGALNAMLARLEAEGVISREVRGRRTYRITLDRPPVATPLNGRHPDSAPAGGSQLQRFADELASSRGMLRAGLLLLLGDRPGHGFDLNERLKALALGAEDPSPVYRALHWLEDAGLLQSSWQIQEAGPARRVYALTPIGRQALELAAANLKERSGMLDEHLTRYLSGRSEVVPKRKRSFEVLIEAKLTVAAFDEASAQRKVERALVGGRALDTDVSATGHVWIYDTTSGQPDVA